MVGVKGKLTIFVLDKSTVGILKKILTLFYNLQKCKNVVFSINKLQQCVITQLLKILKIQDRQKNRVLQYICIIKKIYIIQIYLQVQIHGRGFVVRLCLVYFVVQQIKNKKNQNLRKMLSLALQYYYNWGKIQKQKNQNLRKMFIKNKISLALQCCYNWGKNKKGDFFVLLTRQWGAAYHSHTYIYIKLYFALILQKNKKYIIPSFSHVGLAALKILHTITSLTAEKKQFLKNLDF
eukprot:TRINITY_DN6635_c0_g1_i3.p2 TRINITY_DN6635_c0_g1~~TRINITY_DN6635_c0_g1_i3.p2  ORF type:complete len:276 (-),score=-8.48 TRINITY_DN6635_c0_g1_i3:117-824(-)